MGRLYENIGMLHNSLIKTMFEDVMGTFYENDMRMFHDDVIGKLYGDYRLWERYEKIMYIGTFHDNVIGMLLCFFFLSERLNL